MVEKYLIAHFIKRLKKLLGLWLFLNLDFSYCWAEVELFSELGGSFLLFNIWQPWKTWFALVCSFWFSFTVGDEMNSLDPECNELKQKYDACFNVWFSEKFLKGSADASDDSMCKPIFLVYRECVRVSEGGGGGRRIKSRSALLFFWVERKWLPSA